MSSLGHVGIVGRFKPFHNGAALMLDAALEQARELTLCVGSANRSGVRFPFTANESAMMIRAYLGASPLSATVPVRIATLDDYGNDPLYRDGSRWVEEISEVFKGVETVVSANKYVTELLKDRYRLVHPGAIIPPEKQVPIDGTRVRLAMARGEQWERLVPEPVADYLVINGLVERFRREYGLATIAYVGDHQDTHSYDAEADAVRSP